MSVYKLAKSKELIFFVCRLKNGIGIDPFIYVIKGINVYAVKADIAEIPEMAGRFHVLTAPAWLLFYQGKEVERMARFIPQAQMKQTLAKWTKVAESGHQ